MIVCNPPFFISSTPNPEISRNQARHCITLTHKELLEAAQRLLTPEGSLQLILPVVEAEHFAQQACAGHWSFNKLTRVYPTPKSPEKRRLMLFSLIEREYMEDSLIIETKRHTYHESYHQLTRDFYLKS